MATIKDVAHDAGVSTATVSRVLNGDKKVLESTRELVTKSVEKLGYRIYPAARNLKKGRSQAIGVIVPELSNYFFMQLFEYFEQKLRLKGYSMILCTSNGSIEEEVEVLNYLQAQFVEGILVIPVSMERHHFEAALKTTPIVFVDRSFSGISADSVLVNNTDGTYDVISSLIQDGYRDIAFIGGDENAMTSRERYLGYEKALLDANIPIDSGIVMRLGSSMEAGYAAMDKLLRRMLKEKSANSCDNGFRQHAFFCANLMTLHGATKRVMEEDLEVQKSITGAAFDEIFYANLFFWCKYFVSQPISEMGEVAVNLLLERIENDDQDDYKEVRLKTKVLKYNKMV